MKDFYILNYGYFVFSDDSFDYWRINNIQYPTPYNFLKKDKAYKFEIDNGFCYPSFCGLLEVETLKYFLET